MSESATESVEKWLAARPRETAARGTIACGAVVGGWRVEAFLGSGLSSEVYRVRNVRFGHEAALKLLVNSSRNLGARFMAEADAVRLLNLSVLPHFFGAGTHGQMPYYVMEFLLPLPDPMPRRDIPRFMEKVAKAVHALHDAGFVHRDLKPGNILVRRNGEPVLIDLGLVKRRVTGGAGADWNAGGLSVVDGRPVGVGTPDFAAPEQLYKGRAVVQSDVFALGKIAWALYDGYPPRSMRSVIQRATRQLPEERYRSASAFAAAIRRRNLPVLAAMSVAVVAACAVAFATAHRRDIGRKLLAIMSPPAPVIVHTQRPNEADAAYFARMRPLAESGDLLAQIAVAEAYFHGRGVSSNRVSAVEWYRRAAEAGEAHAQASLGLCLLRGWGCERDPHAAVEWYAKAVAQGHLGAMNDLAFCQIHGLGVAKDPTNGFQLAMKAAVRGHAASQTLVGECYLDGVGVEPDTERGETWLYRAARQDNRRAQMLLRSR